MIRPWKAEDGAALRPMIEDCLDVNFRAGADMLPTDKNAAALLALGMIRAAAGDPCLVSTSGTGRLQAYTLWVDLPNPLGLDYGSRILYGLGTYVEPALRRLGVSDQLRDAAEAMARAQGFDKIVGTVYHTAGAASCLRRGFRVTGQLVEKVLRQ